MKQKIVAILIIIFSTSSSAADNFCEKIWHDTKNKYKDIKVISKDVPCKDIWNDPIKDKIVQNMNIQVKNSNWMSTGSCQSIQINNNLYLVYEAYLKPNHSDIQIIHDRRGNYFSYFRELGSYDVFENKFHPTKQSNSNGVELKCTGLGQYKVLQPILSSYLHQRAIDMTHFSFEDFGK